MAATSVRAIDRRVMCRLYATNGESASARARTRGMRQVALRSLAGEAVAELRPFQIGELELERDVIAWGEKGDGHTDVC